MNSVVPIKPAGSRRLLLGLAASACAALIALGARFSGLETVFYDAFQRYQHRSVADQIILVTADPSAANPTDIWSAAGFSRLVRALAQHEPAVISATQTLKLPEVPPAEQIAALAELQKQAARSGSPAAELQQLAAQVAGFRKHFDEQKELGKTLLEARNVVLPARRREFGDTEPVAAPCAAHAVSHPDMERSQLATVALIPRLHLPPDAICAASGGVGFSDYTADPDGVVRHTRLLVDASGTLLPSLPLAILAALEGTDARILGTDGNNLQVRERVFPTAEDFAVYTRFYAGREATDSFRQVTAAAVLNNEVPSDWLQGHIVLIGDAPDSSENRLATPLDESTPRIQLTAHNLNNLLNQDYLLRPSWLPWLEYAVFGALLVLAVVWAPGLPAVAAVPVGMVLAMLVFSTEAWLLLSERVWAQLGSAAVFAAAAVWLMQPLQRLFPQQMRQVSGSQRPTPTIVSGSAEDQLDLEFSVLRQQPVTDRTKAKMYQIAFQHGRAEEFAKAERVLRYIHQHDPAYKDVARLLEKLTGRRQYTPLQQNRKSEPAASAAQKTGSGRKLGRYTIERKLGEGAMATVYMGSDPNIGRKVAIKTVKLAEEFDEAKLSEARLQFRREAESAGRLNHPNIIAIYDAGEDGDVSYLAMEYFEGVALLKHAQPNDLLPASWVLELMARAADALDYAHRQNVVHRDIKPANILYNAATDELKLTDFGIARLTDSSRTKTGIILGTPSYMSPEQLMASGVTGRSDLYSLGVTMYQLLTGVAPFRADSIPKLMDKIMRESHRPVRESRSDIPVCVDDILVKALAKDPEDRFGSGRAMAMALRDCARQIARTA
ncbi:MAG: serine/threonine-protein kinase [Gammaproteobacteria bacterium]|jgi:serine/threonine-protein kinase|nr:serine/threonine-protein kinase [Gammaproteobacteria bacterium]